MGLLRLSSAILGWLLAAGAFAAAALGLAGAADPRLDLFTHLAPAYLAIAMVALAFSALAPRRGRLPLAAAALLAGAAASAVVAPEFLGGPSQPVAPAAASGQLKIIQFNTWSRNARPEAVVDWLVSEAPDVMVIEEPGRIRDLLRARGYQAACPACGTSIFTREKPVRTFTAKQAGSRSSFLAGATYRDARGEFTVMGVHRSWPTRFARRARESAELMAALQDAPKDRLILAGDFNSTPWSFAHRREDAGLGLIRRTRALPTWPAEKVSDNRLPAPFPYLPIDHVYAGRGWATVKVALGPKLGSDHYPVVVTLAPAGSVAK